MTSIFCRHDPHRACFRPYTVKGCCSLHLGKQFSSQKKLFYKNGRYFSNAALIFRWLIVSLMLRKCVTLLSVKGNHTRYWNSLVSDKFNFFVFSYDMHQLRIFCLLTNKDLIILRPLLIFIAHTLKHISLYNSQQNISSSAVHIKIQIFSLLHWAVKIMEENSEEIFFYTNEF